MSNIVRYIRAVGVHRRFDLEIELQPGVNILFGKNGTGKTTLLHILANILNGDFERFAFLPFETIEVHLDNNQRITLREYSHSEGDKIEVHIDKSEVARFPVDEAKNRLMNRSITRAEITSASLRALQWLKPIIPTAYFPAFRTLIEASGNDDPPLIYEYPSSPPRRRLSERQTVHSTIFARRFFGHFVPWINYPSPEEVSQRLSIFLLF
jgi:DNA polymerase III delta prime subunit